MKTTAEIIADLEKRVGKLNIEQEATKIPVGFPKHLATELRDKQNLIVLLRAVEEIARKSEGYSWQSSFAKESITTVTASYSRP